VNLDHPLDVFIFGWPGEGGDGVAERDAAVEPSPEIGGLGEGVGGIGQAAGDDREEVVEGVNALVLPNGTAAAVLIDAFIIRALLVPALMALLEDWNWWSPAPLRHFHQRLTAGHRPPAQDQAAPPTLLPADSGLLPTAH
jgi:hypothetical protein